MSTLCCLRHLIVFLYAFFARTGLLKKCRKLFGTMRISSVTMDGATELHPSSYSGCCGGMTTADWLSLGVVIELLVGVCAAAATVCRCVRADEGSCCNCEACDVGCFRDKGCADDEDVNIDESFCIGQERMICCSTVRFDRTFMTNTMKHSVDNHEHAKYAGKDSVEFSI